MLKWAVGAGDHAASTGRPEADGQSEITDTPTSRPRLSLRRTSERFHVLPAREMQIKWANVRTICKEGKENPSSEHRLRPFGAATTQLEMEQRGPLGDVTNQSPVTSPRTVVPAEKKATPARIRSRRSVPKARNAADAENNSDLMRPNCTSCHSTPKRRLSRRTPKRKKTMEPQLNVSPLKPSDLCIDYSPDLGGSLLALRKRLEESVANHQVENPLYFDLQPPVGVLSTVSPLSRRVSQLRLSTPEKPPPLPEKPPPKRSDSDNSSVMSQFVASLKDINLSPLDATITNNSPPTSSSGSSGGSRKRTRRHSDGHTPVAGVQRQRRFSETSSVSARSASIGSSGHDTTLKANEASIALTLPTPRLTPELICWRNSVASSEVSALNETWDSHRLHTLFRQQDKALPADQDTPPFQVTMETKSIADMARQEPFTPLSAACEATIQHARIVDLTSLTSRTATTSGVDIVSLIDTVLREVRAEEDAFHTPVVGGSFSEQQSNKDSPVALVDRQSRSRRCLSYVSPCGRQRSALNLTPCRKRKKRPRAKGELKLSLYRNAGLLTVHVISATNLPQRDPGKPASAFVKICVLPKKGCDGGPIGETQRTNVRRPASGPAGCPVYRFDQKFSLELDAEEQVASECRVLVSVWLRPRAEKHRKSECVGCMSFGVGDVFKQDVRGSFLVLSPSTGRSQNVAVTKSTGQLTGSKNSSEMAEHMSDSSLDDARENDAVTPRRHDKRRSGYRKAFSTPSTQTEDNTFLCHLELEPPAEEGQKPSSALGRTPFTTTKKLMRKQGTGFGFSVAWTQPPRVERVEAGLPADKAGMRPGDYIIFVENQNVVTMPEDAILNLIRLGGNNLTLEVYRRTTPNGVVLQQPQQTPAVPMPPPATRRSASVTDCSATTSDLRKRLQLPQVTFSSEAVLSTDDARKRAIYQLLQKLQQFALSMRFGVDRFLVPLADRKDLLSSQDHFILFQNSEELVMLTEEMLEQMLTDDTDSLGQNLGRVYVNKVQALTNAYRKYCLGLKKADCLLAQQSSHPGFMKVVSDPPIPKRRPDLTTFLHKPLEHYRETLKLLQTVLKNSKVNDEEYAALSKVVHAFEVTYKDITANSGLMEPDSEGKPLLSIQDLESRLVFTKCKPFKLNTGGRQWIFGGDLSRIEGRSSKAYWALLFSDLLLLATVSRDKVLFVTDEPLSLLAVTQACFTIKKKENEFRLIIDAPPPSPLDANAKKDKSGKSRRKSIAFRAPTPELKAVWQNLIQRQIIYLNTVRGGTPSASPLDSPAEQPSIATVDSPSRLQVRPDPFLAKLEESLIESTPRPPQPKHLPRELLETPIDAALLESSPRTFKEARMRILESKRRFLESNVDTTSWAEPLLEMRKSKSGKIDSIAEESAAAVVATETPKRSASGEMPVGKRPKEHAVKSSVSVEAVRTLAEIVDTPKKVVAKTVDLSKKKQAADLLRKDVPKPPKSSEHKKQVEVKTFAPCEPKKSTPEPKKSTPEPKKSTPEPKKPTAESKKLPVEPKKSPSSGEVKKTAEPIADVAKKPPEKPPRKHLSIESNESKDGKDEKENDDPLNVLLHDLFFPLQVTQTQIHASTSFDAKSSTNPMHSIFSDLFTPKQPADKNNKTLLKPAVASNKNSPSPTSKSKPQTKPEPTKTKSESKNSIKSENKPKPADPTKKPVKSSSKSTIKPLSSDMISEAMRQSDSERKEAELLLDNDSDRESIASHKRLGGTFRKPEPP
ncbi:Hypothetical predicted protein [Cloeon dipterum]|uniref:DH domain-containing protein n=1 Tax=Cloeon dipterum TaxID=197152 RepID=A0A8S1CSX7_9INSE|nr:Hypothetical predicted protein [Cloeon dipterum]